MSKYDSLNPRTELEQEIAKDLKRAFEKRGFEVRHNGTENSHATGGKSDIEMWDNNVHINIEVTKTKKSSQDREYQSIKDHLIQTKSKNPRKKVFMWFISPETYYRTFNSVKDSNFINHDKEDMKIIAISFSTFEIFINKLIETTKDFYTKEEVISLFKYHKEFVDDESVLRFFVQKLFPEDTELIDEIKEVEEDKHEKVVKELISGFKLLEDRLRSYRIALATKAIMNVIYLVFIKLYEEKRQSEGKGKNRFTFEGFKEYQEAINNKKNAIHELFENIKNDKEIKKCELFNEADILEERLKDDFIIEHFIEVFEQYHFYTTKIDGLGAAYEVLGQLSGKDTKAGQFFTPENVVDFMVRLAELDFKDVILDPACGTARFLTYGMENMLKKVEGKRNETELIDDIKHKQLFGSDDDPLVSKLAKMNMYIHGDGKTNIQAKDGLTLKGFDDKFDVILTNPPLGDLSYRHPSYNEDFRTKRMSVIPKKSITNEKIKRLKNQLEKSKDEKKTERLEKEIAKLEWDKENGKEEFESTGNQMKGGALFINACYYYLADKRDTDEVPEWRGGKFITIIDEGVLNTDDYENVRNFIKKHFYIKAVISLTQDTFVPVSKTPAKTSVIYLIKKEDPDAKQQEPIFYAHASKVGKDTKGRACDNHLINQKNKDVLRKYFEFKEAVKKSYRGNQFDKNKFESLNIVEDWFDEE